MKERGMVLTVFSIIAIAFLFSVFAPTGYYGTDPTGPSGGPKGYGGWFADEQQYFPITPSYLGLGGCDGDNNGEIDSMDRQFVQEFAMSAKQDPDWMNRRSPANIRISNSFFAPIINQNVGLSDYDLRTVIGDKWDQECSHKTGNY